jgi:3-dehydroquinate synthase
MKIQSKIKDYSVEMIDNLLDKKEEIFSGLKYERLFYFVDNNVYKFYLKKLKQFIGDDVYLVIDALETNKEYNNLAKYYKALIEAGFTRDSILVTIGGGVLQDISGFIASTLYRGIKWMFFPTTLLAQADSCIGSKTSINFGNSKNLIGSFFPPDKIFIDIAFCDTLTLKYFNSGLGEIIKFHLLSNEKGYGLLRKYLASSELKHGELFKNIIWSTLEIKKSYFEGDEFDTGRRNLLNYGHCFGHALESASNFEICHGEAVLVGMGLANLLSLKRGVMKKEKYVEFENIFRKYYPKFDVSKINIEDIIYYLKRDKKRVGKDLTMILSENIGRQFKFNDIQEKESMDVFDEFVRKYPKFYRR